MRAGDGHGQVEPIQNQNQQGVASTLSAQAMSTNKQFEKRTTAEVEQNKLSGRQ